MKHFVAILLLLLVVFTLSGCESESEKEVDKLVNNYVKKEYRVNSTIVESEDVNEGNMGDRTFIMKSKEKIPVTFRVYLEGMFHSKVVGDDYQKQKKAAISGGEFWEKNKKELQSLGFSYVKYSNVDNSLHATVFYNHEVNLFDPKTVKELSHFFKLFMDTEPTPSLLSFKSKSINAPIGITDFSGLDDEETLKNNFLENNIYFANLSLFKRDYKGFDAMRKGIEKRGYKLEFRMTGGYDGDKTFYCYKEYYHNHECAGGYTVSLIGGKPEKESLFELVQLIKSQSIKVRNVSFHDHGIYMEDLSTINRPEDIEIIDYGE